MSVENSLNFYLIGSELFLKQYGNLLLEEGLKILLVVTDYDLIVSFSKKSNVVVCYYPGYGIIISNDGVIYMFNITTLK